MMETQKILKPAGKIVIISDYRERDVIEFLKKTDAIVNEINLEVGDFICSDRRIAIERKTHSDFISSITDGRIFEQARLMKNNFEKPIVVIEGHSDRQISENSFKAAVASLLVDFNVSLLNTRNPYDTARTIYWIAKKEQEESKHGISFKVGKKPRETKELQERIVSSLPGINTTISKRLLECFKTIEGIYTADEKELQKVKGIGKILAGRIKKILTEKYE